LDRIGLLNNIHVGASNIDEGRKGFAIPGKERQGRISYEDGIALAMAAFQEAQRSADPQTIILVETAFLSQELEFCAKGDIDSRNSLAYAIQAFRDAGPPQVAMRSLEAVEDAAGYKIAEKTHPTDPKKRVHGHLRWSGFPADAFHQACSSHKTRLHNILRAPGIEMLEKALLKQRAANMKAAQGAYVEKQRKALSG
jgi:hypothetical protein